jgi:glutamate-1-semialdehyde aminotransferase/spore coat polysaccharide biosynthesis protein SpsF (cytidylyltransferase family)
MSESKRVVAIALARMGSTRVPGKVLRDLEDTPVLDWVINALDDVPAISQIVLATSTNPGDDVIEEYCKKNYIDCFRGSEEDVLDRFYHAAKEHRADLVVRVTCDCPFIDPAVISQVIKLREMRDVEYCSNVDPATWPDGLDTEIFTFAALETAHKEATRPSDRNTVTQFITRNRYRFKSANLTCPLPGLAKERWVLDTEDDWKFCCEIAKHVLPGTSYLEILDVIDRNPSLRDINNVQRGSLRNERHYKQLATESLGPRTCSISGRMFESSINRIPFAAQTFSKSHLQYPKGGPLFVTHGDGARVYDVDGNDYVDLVGALLPIILGYRDSDVDAAIRHQLDQGISFSLATELEWQLSELLCKHIPCAEMVKFGKSGTDVTTAAVRLARAYTGRDHVLVGGYHGWADWSVAVTERNLGIPRDIRKLSHRIPHGSSLDEGWRWRFTPNEIAAFIVEPESNPEWLERVRKYCSHFGIVLIFDEVITGFRYDLGGAQKLWGVTPDLACFGKAMANGMPISALVGRRDIMKKMEPPDNIFYSGTFFGETLSIAAAIATINKIEKERVIGHLWMQGIRLDREILRAKLRYDDTADLITVSGEHPLLRLNFKTEQVKSLFMQTMIQNGVLIIGSNNLTFAHKDAELKRIVTAYHAAFGAITKAIRDGSIDKVEPTAGTPVRTLVS